MNGIDRKIIFSLQEDNRISMSLLAEKTGLSISAVNERVRKLQNNGTIQRNQAIITPGSVGLDLLAFLFIDLQPDCDEDAFVQEARSFPELQELHHITGPHSYLAKVRVADTNGLQQFLKQRLKALPAVTRTETIVVLQSEKETSILPV
ncbi:Lrp/AsnC family transcriptional regulator [Kiloniella laminariae]|uniref:Lrp/AsnC family transcriptional regulator n=1 Tax=Kiloniella laminariae TaxID=454162 RepID=UPI00037C9E29|nr:Lrp/AsnC family transcriptional regulator [Kiloniella laminariae]